MQIGDPVRFSAQIAVDAERDLDLAMQRQRTGIGRGELSGPCIGRPEVVDGAASVRGGDDEISSNHCVIVESQTDGPIVLDQDLFDLGLIVDLAAESQVASLNGAGKFQRAAGRESGVARVHIRQAATDLP